MKEIARGAEAVLYDAGESILKERKKKSYRIKEVEDNLRVSRTRREAKILEKLSSSGVPAPKLIKTDRDSKVEMEKIKGEALKHVLDANPELAAKAGENLAKMHDEGIMHGDLTTSNMIYKDDLYFIDFGLSFFSQKVEDMAVDIHLFRQALESRHHRVWQEAFKHFLEAYKKESKKSKQVIKRLEEVEKRGRHKEKW